MKISPPRSLPAIGRQRSMPTLDTSFTSIPGSGDSDSSRRLRRKVDSRRTISPESYSCPISPHPQRELSQANVTFKSVESPATTASEEDEGEIEGEGDLEEAVGQLSMNEDEQVRFHGKASGLHLLAPQERVDGRSEGGIWKFPKARVWPPLPPTGRAQLVKEDGESPTSLPPLEEQEKLLDLYWKYVHTALPIVYKQSFLESFRRRSASRPLFSPTSSLILSPAPLRAIPLVLLGLAHLLVHLRVDGTSLRSSFSLCSLLPLATPASPDQRPRVRCGLLEMPSSNRPNPSWHRYILPRVLGPAKPSCFWVTERWA